MDCPVEQLVDARAVPGGIAARRLTDLEDKLGGLTRLQLELGRDHGVVDSEVHRRTQLHRQLVEAEARSPVT